MKLGNRRFIPVLTSTGSGPIDSLTASPASPASFSTGSKRYLLVSLDVSLYNTNFKQYARSCFPKEPLRLISNLSMLWLELGFKESSTIAATLDWGSLLLIRTDLANSKTGLGALICFQICL